MQWIIDIVKFKLASYLKGKIFIWAGSIANIPPGWALCNGTQGTPNLQDMFIVGAGSSYNPADNGGSIIHKHAYELAGVWHSILVNGDLLAGDGCKKKTTTHYFAGTTNWGKTRPPFYALAYIMKL